MLVPLMNRGKFILIILLGFYLVEVQDYLFVNLFYSEVVCNFWNFNLLLTNNLNKYHPHIFYFSTWLLFSLSLYQISILGSRTHIFTPIKVARKSYSLLYFAKVINSFALFLGSWWAFQEGTWGGWWNWDPSEVLGLLVLLSTLLLLHKLPSYLTTWSLVQKTYICVAFFIWVYFFTQLNFDLVSHNFGNRFTFFFVNTLFYLDFLLIMTLFLLTVVALKKIIHQSLRLTLLKKKSQTKLLIWSGLLTIFWALLVLWSFQPLFNYFLWQYLTINFWNGGADFNLIYYGLVFIVWGVFARLNYLRSAPFILTHLWGFTWPYSLLGQVTKGALEFWSIFHTMFLMSVLVNILDNQTTLTLINQRIPLLKIFGESVETGTNFMVWCVEDLWKEKAYHHATLNSCVTSYSFMTTQSSIEINQFSFYQNSNQLTAIIDVNYGVSGLQRSYNHPYFSLFYELILFLLILIKLKWFKII